MNRDEATGAILYSLETRKLVADDIIAACPYRVHQCLFSGQWYLKLQGVLAPVQSPAPTLHESKCLQGMLIGPYDLLIAGLVKSLDLTLVTSNIKAEFIEFPFS